MKKLTTRNTFYYKRIFPTLWFGFLGVFIFTGLFSLPSTRGPGVAFLVFPVFMAVFGYFMFKRRVWDLMDEAYDDGTTLLLRNRGREVRVSLKDIKNVSYSVMTNPPRVTLSLRHKTDLGDELTFSPAASWIPFKKNPDIKALIDRIDEARLG